MQNEAARLMMSRAGLNQYTTGSDRKYFFGKPDNVPGDTSQAGYSDCSSACRMAILAAGGIDIGSNTDAQIKNRAGGIIVDQTDGYYPDQDNLLPGDCLYFKGNTSHELDVGHVEMYVGGGKCYGHGSGTGPKMHDVQSYCKSRATAKKRYFMAIRWIYEDDAADEGDLTVAAGSWNVRVGAGTEYESAGIVHGGDILTKAETEGWTPIVRENRIEWISDRALA